MLQTDRAIAMSVYVIRAFIEQREKLAANAAILKRLAEIDKTLLLEHDTALGEIYQKLLPPLAPPPEPSRRQNGFHTALGGSPQSLRYFTPPLVFVSLAASAL